MVKSACIFTFINSNIAFGFQFLDSFGIIVIIIISFTHKSPAIKHFF